MKDAFEPLVAVESGPPPVSGFLHRAHGGSDSIVLTHGAGGNAKAPLLVALCERLAAIGINALRCDLPFRQRRPSGPPSPSNAQSDQDGLRRAVELMRERFDGCTFLGGISYGGRQASMLVAGDPGLVSGLLLLSYPLHPPGKEAQVRTAHFPKLQIPVLFVSGTKDPFGSQEELREAIKLIPAKTRLVPIEGAGHGLLQRSNREVLPGKIVEEFRSLFGV
jgi:uncharacterized protein